MAKNQYTRIRDHYMRVLARYQEKDYEAAHELSLEGADLYPEGKNFLLHAAAYMAARMGDQQKTMAYLNEVLADGYWLSEAYLADEDFDSVRDTPEFQHFSEASLAAYHAAVKDIRPELHVVQPDEQSSRLLLALHGNGSNIADQLDNWRPAAGHGWWMAMPQSTEVAGLNFVGELGFNWNNYETACPEVVAHHAALVKGYGIDEVVLGGFSRGGEMAIQTAVMGAITSQGFVAVCPGGPLTMQPDNWQPVIAGNDVSSLRGVMILGGKDQRVPENKQVVEMLREAGAEVELEVYPDMGHEFPPDFGARLEGFLGFIAGA